MRLTDYLKQQGYTIVDSGYSSLVERWAKWYSGNVEEFHDYTIYNGSVDVRMKRAQLNMAKQGAEYWAGLLWNNESFITVDGANSAKDENGETISSDAERAVNEVLQANSFNYRTQQLVEQAFALGTGAFLVYPADGGPVIKYIGAQFIYPLAWDDNDCTSCAFAGISARANGIRELRLMIHTQQPDKSYLIRNEYFELDPNGEIRGALDTPPGVEEEYTVKTRRFALVRPNIHNNIAYNVPLGISVYANAIDILKCIDLAFDGIKVSMMVGRPRIAVAAEAVKSDGYGFKPTFDTNDIALYQLPESADFAQKALIQDITTAYRAGEFETSLQSALTLYSRTIGLGDKAFKWATGSIETATQVITENSDLQRTMEKHQELLRPALETVVRAVLDILKRDPNVDISVTFDDSAVRDRASERQRFWQYVTAGYYPFWKYLVEFEGYSASEAMEIEEAAGKANLEDLLPRAGIGEE